MDKIQTAYSSVHDKVIRAYIKKTKETIWQIIRQWFREWTCEHSAEGHFWKYVSGIGQLDQIEVQVKCIHCDKDSSIDKDAWLACQPYLPDVHNETKQ